MQVAFNQIRGIEKLGMIPSVVGNERTEAANAAMRARIRESRKGLAVPAKPKQIKAPIDPWTLELMRMGFVL